MYNQISSNKRATVLLMLLSIVVMIGLGWAIGQWTDSPGTIISLAVIIVVAINLASYYSGDKIALATAGAHYITKEENPYVYRMVENLCITAGLPMPKVYIIDDPALNAFATGRDPKHASIAVTTGLIQSLENEELEGVIAHELSHVKNYDIRLMMIVIVTVGFITLLSNMLIRGRGGLFRGGRRNSSGELLMIIGLVLIILSPIFSRLIQFAVSRRREFLADASGALLTRYPEGLAKALEKIGNYKQPMRRVNSATAHLYITNPFSGTGKSMRNLFSTHPPIAERIKALRTMA